MGILSVAMALKRLMDDWWIDFLLDLPEIVIVYRESDGHIVQLHPNKSKERIHSIVPYHLIDLSINLDLLDALWGEWSNSLKK